MFFKVRFFLFFFIIVLVKGVVVDAGVIYKFGLFKRGFECFFLIVNLGEVYFGVINFCGVYSRF